MQRVKGQWRWDNVLNRNVFHSDNGKRYGATYKRTDFSVTEIYVRPPCKDGTVQGECEFLLDGMEADWHILD